MVADRYFFTACTKVKFESFYDLHNYAEELYNLQVRILVQLVSHKTVSSGSRSVN